MITGVQRTFQIHPSLRCNLTCAHCYSDSGPGSTTEMPADLLRSAIDDAAAMGYRRLSVSGGEPFLLRSLPGILAHARARGMRTAVTTNGLAFGGGRLEAAAPHLDLVAVSCDGPSTLHEAMRGPGTFRRLEAGLARLAGSGLRYGLIHTLTSRSWPHLTELAAFAVDHGAASLQLHPLESVGRAAGSGDTDRAWTGRAWLLARAVGIEYRDRLVVHVDLATRPALRDGSGLVPPPAGAVPAEALDVLVLEADGVVVPLTYGMSRRHAVADLATSGLARSWPDYVRTRHERLRALCDRLREDCLASDDQLVSWFDLLTTRSHDPAPARGDAA